MAILQRYVFKVIFSSLALILTILVAVDLLFEIVSQLEEVGRGGYDFRMMLFVVLLSLPRVLYEYFPIAALLGVLVGLGVLANHSELTVIRASGVSLLSIIRLVFRPILVVMVVVVLLSEFVVPVSDVAAEQLRFQSRYGVEKSGPSHLWLRIDDDVVYVAQVVSAERLRKIVRFHFYAGLRLYGVTFADLAVYQDGAWEISGIRKLLFDKQGVIDMNFDQEVWKQAIEPELLSQVENNPSRLSVRDLWRYTDYLKNNGLDSRHFDLAFWQKVLLPLTVLVMVFLALPFVLGSLRTYGIGMRIVSGVAIGFVFYLFTQVVGPLLVLYHLPPLFAALLPSLLFFTVAYVLLRRQALT